MLSLVEEKNLVLLVSHMTVSWYFHVLTFESISVLCLSFPLGVHSKLCLKIIRYMVRWLMEATTERQGFTGAQISLEA